MADSDADGVIKRGYLFKQGGSYRSWKKRYFILKESSLVYYIHEGDVVPRGTIDLTTGRGVRTRSYCQLEWPSEAKPGLAFGLATETRTFYLYGNDSATVREWMTKMQEIIKRVGKPTNDWKNDPEGKPESVISKAVRGAAKLGTQITKKAVSESGLVDEDTAKIVGSVADAVENQAEAGSDATITDRLKVAGGDAAGIVADNVDNEVVQVGASVVQEQAEADDDSSLQQRLLMATGTTLEGASDLVDNEVASGVLSTAAGVAKDQAEADEDLSLKQRLVLAGGSALEGTSEMVDNEVVSAAMEVGGGVVKDQAEADEDASLKERLITAVGSTAGGVAELDAVKWNKDVTDVCDAVQEVAENLGEEEGKESSSSSSSDTFL